MKIKMMALDKDGIVWDMQEIDARRTKNGNLNRKAIDLIQFAIYNMGSNFIYTVDKIEITRVEE